MYGAIFMMAGAYTLCTEAHVRGDVIYRLFPQRTQAWIDVVLYFIFFFPGVIALAFYCLMDNQKVCIYDGSWTEWATKGYPIDKT